jgi:dolichol-phosphate mannosyltransferase
MQRENVILRGNMEDSDYYDLTVIIPTYKEEKNIRLMIQTIDQVCQSDQIREEILVVDDNSPDATGKIVTEMMQTFPNLNLLVRNENPGLSQSIYDGITRARSDLIQCIDCDFSHPPDMIPVFYHSMKDDGCDFVIGSRYTPGGSVRNWPMKRRVLSFGAALFGRILIPHITDSGSGFFAINRQILPGVALKPRGFRMAFEILGKARWNSTREIPIAFKDREFGVSKLKGLLVKEYFIQWCDIFYQNIIAGSYSNIIRSWKVFLHKR